MDGIPDVLKPPRQSPLIRRRFAKGPHNPEDFISRSKQDKQNSEQEAKVVEEALVEEKREEEPVVQEPVVEAKEELTEDTLEEDEEKTSEIKIPEGEPSGKETIKITGRTYELDFDLKNRKRRADIFSGNSSKQLTEQEEELMKAIGITGSTKTELMPYLADFFNSLPKCHSSSQMLTNSRCEIAYYIMWSVLLKARQATQKKIEADNDSGITDIETQQIAASVDALSSIKGSPINNQNHREHMQIIDIVTRIETNLKEVKQAVDNLPKHGGARRYFQRSF